jgi:hypothetical protein
MTEFAIPEIPWDLIASQRNAMRKPWSGDYSLQTPALWLDYPWSFTLEGKTYTSFSCFAEARRRVEDAESDVRCQLEVVGHQVECLRCGIDLGLPLMNVPAFDLIHYGTAPLATAFGSAMILREGHFAAFGPAVHTAEEVLKLRKPDLLKAGVLPRILERIQYYSDVTQGKVILTPCDTAGPWSIATSIWHYQDMLEAIHTAPEAVHYLLDLVTDCTIEWYNIQETYIGRWGRSHSSFSSPFFPRGIGIGDDTLVAVSPATWEEFFLPYNNRLTHEYGNAILYHCCMRYDTHFPSIDKTDGFKGLDAGVDHNDFDKIEAALVQARGIWSRPLGPQDMDLIDRLRGKVGLLFAVSGSDRTDAIRQARDFLADLDAPGRTRWRSEFVRRWNVSKLLPAADIGSVGCVRLDDPLDWQSWPGQTYAIGNALADIQAKYGAADGLVYAANRFMVERAGRWLPQPGGGPREGLGDRDAGALARVHRDEAVASQHGQADCALIAVHPAKRGGSAVLLDPGVVEP